MALFAAPAFVVSSRLVLCCLITYCAAAWSAPCVHAFVCLCALSPTGMRELWATGWMQQSVRMVAAAFLTEYLNLPWTAGAAWFHDCLVSLTTQRVRLLHHSVCSTCTALPGLLGLEGFFCRFLY